MLDVWITERQLNKNVSNRYEDLNALWMESRSLGTKDGTISWTRVNLVGVVTTLWNPTCVMADKDGTIVECGN